MLIQSRLGHIKSPALPTGIADALATTALATTVEPADGLLTRFTLVAFPVAATAFAAAILFFATATREHVQTPNTLTPDVVNATLTSTAAINTGGWFAGDSDADDADDG